MRKLRQETREQCTLEKSEVGRIGLIGGEDLEEGGNRSAKGKGVECHLKDVVERLDRLRREFENIT